MYWRFSETNDEIFALLALYIGVTNNLDRHLGRQQSILVEEREIVVTEPTFLSAFPRRVGNFLNHEVLTLIGPNNDAVLGRVLFKMRRINLPPDLQGRETVGLVRVRS